MCVCVCFFVFGFLITHDKNTRVLAVPWTRLNSTLCRFHNSTSLVNATQDDPPSLSAALDTSFIARVHSVVELSIFESINSNSKFLILYFWLHTRTSNGIFVLFLLDNQWEKENETHQTEAPKLGIFHVCYVRTVDELILNSLFWLKISR